MIPTLQNNQDTASALSKLWKWEECKSISEWVEKYVDLSLVPAYDTPLHTSFDMGLCPFWKQPLNDLLSNEVREVVIWKPSRIGATENIALNAIRYHTYQDPLPMLFVASQQEAVERFFQDRIVLGLDAVKKSVSNSPRRVVGTRYYQNGASLMASYPANKSVDKMSGYQFVCIDEASLCPNGTCATLRKRIETYRYAHLLILSSMDARNNCTSREDTIWQEWNDGSQHEWFLNDGVGDFILTLGTDKTKHGLKWDNTARDKNGNWDFNKVYATAHYVTPNGKIWNTSDKNLAVKAGKWVPTNDKPYDKRKHSYRISGLASPFRSGDLGEMAVAFIKAQSSPEQLRIFIYENLAEEWKEKQIVNTESNIKQNVGKYLHQNKPSVAHEYFEKWKLKEKVTLLTADIHEAKNGYVYSVREWVTGGDSGLIDFGSVDTWADLKNIQLKYGCNKIFVDGSYNTEEVKQTLITAPFFNQAIICFGREQIKEMYQTKLIDPFEATVHQGRYQLPSITHNPNKIKNELYRLINKGTNKDWLLPLGVDLDEYIKQLQSEAQINGKWTQTATDNHYWDTEVLQLLGAIVLGLYKFSDVPEVLTATDAIVTPNNMPASPTPTPPPIKPPVNRFRVTYG